MEWNEMDRFGRNGLKWIELDKNIPKWTEVDHNRPNEPKYAKLDQIDQTRWNGIIIRQKYKTHFLSFTVFHFSPLSMHFVISVF